jgi:hypothetical protein
MVGKRFPLQAITIFPAAFVDAVVVLKRLKDLLKMVGFQKLEWRYVFPISLQSSLTPLFLPTRASNAT